MLALEYYHTDPERLTWPQLRRVWALDELKREALERMQRK